MEQKYYILRCLIFLKGEYTIEHLFNTPSGTMMLTKENPGAAR